MTLLDLAPILAAAFAIPQFVPQIRRVWLLGDTKGVSWSWSALASVNNAAWLVYFLLSAYWTAIVPVASASTLAGALALILAWRGKANARSAAAVAAWVGILAVALATGGVIALGTLLTVAFLVQMAPSLWTAYRTAEPSGISRGTWLLVSGELACWLAYGLYKVDPRLITLGVTGLVCTTLMLARTIRAPRFQSAT